MSEITQNQDAQKNSTEKLSDLNSQLTPEEQVKALEEFLDSKKEKTKKTENSSNFSRETARLEAEDTEEGNHEDYMEKEMWEETPISEFNPEPNNNIWYASVWASEEHNKMMEKIVWELNSQEKPDILKNLGEEEKTIYNDLKRYIDNSSMSNDEIWETLDLLRDLLEWKINREEFYNNLPNENEFNKVIEHYESDLGLDFDNSAMN